LQENKPDEAVKDLEEILKKQPSQKDALFLMTQARLALGQLDQARALSAIWKNIIRIFRKPDCSKFKPSFRRRRTGKRFAAGERAFERLKILVRTRKPTRKLCRNFAFGRSSARGLAFLELGKIAEAKADLQEIVRLSPNSSAALVNLAKVFAAEANFGEALNLYEKALNADAKNFDALSGMVNVLVRQKQTAQAHARIDGQSRKAAG
jgi:tetratricopeptide (TPR) repeat protein